MKKYLKMLKQTQLFAGVGEDDIFAMLGCLQAKCVIYKKGEHIFRQGEHLSCIAIVAEGSIHIQKHDYWGNRSIINIVGVGEMFGEAYAAHSVRCQQDPHRMLVCMPIPCDGRQESFLCYLGKKSQARTETRPYGKTLYTRKAHLLSVGGSQTSQQRYVHHTVQSSTACRLPCRRPQCHVKRAWKNAR